MAAVSRTEAFLFDVLWMVLARYPQKLSISEKGNAGELTLPLPAFLHAKKLSEVGDALVRQRLSGVAYLAPREYLKYFHAVTGIDVSAPEFNEFIEIKATRDLVVHNSGVINDIYLGKVGTLARGKRGKAIPIDRVYYDTSIAGDEKARGKRQQWRVECLPRRRLNEESLVARGLTCVAAVSRVNDGSLRSLLLIRLQLNFGVRLP